MAARAAAIAKARNDASNSDEFVQMEMKKRKAEAEKMAREKKLADMKKKAGAGVAAAKEDIEAKKVAAKAAMAGAQLAAFEQLEKRKAQLAKMKARLGGVDWKALTKRYMPTLCATT